MPVATFIKPIQTKKGMFYTFQSANEDLNLTFNASGTSKFRFSKFALARIPEIGTPDAVTDNKIQFMAQGETALIDGINADNNINLAQSFQNYCLNFESLLTSQATYNREKKLNVSERVFWKWLKELGAVRWRDATLVERDADVLGSEKRFCEEDEAISTYKRVIKYIGDIEVVNSVKDVDNAYTEIYIYVPGNVGTTPYTMFKSVSDENYYANMAVTNNPTDPLDIEYLNGRHYYETHPHALSIKAMYDLDDNSVTNDVTPVGNYSESLFTPGIWFNGTINNSYYTDGTQVGPSMEFNLAHTQLVRKDNGVTEIKYLRSKLDGVCVDFELGNYKLANQNPSVKSLSHFADSIANQEFEYNAILVYYDLYDPNKVDSNGKFTDVQTNLYGILFLNKIEPKGLEFMIPTNFKSRPDPISQSNGNAFAHKINTKLDASAEDVSVERSINDYNNFSLDLFFDYLTEQRRLINAFNDSLFDNVELGKNLNSLKDALLNTESLNKLTSRIQTVEESLTEGQMLLDNSSSIMKMIEKVQKTYDDLTQNKSSIAITYNLDAIVEGDDMELIKLRNNKLKISNKQQEFNLDVDAIFDVTDFVNVPSKTFALNRFANYHKHEHSGAPMTLNNDLVLRIDDTLVPWKKGQSFELVFADSLFLGQYNLKLVTDAKNKLNSAAAYSAVIASWYDEDFWTLQKNGSGVIDTTNKPIFRIVCTDADLLTFTVDKIK